MLVGGNDKARAFFARQARAVQTPNPGPGSSFTGIFYSKSISGPGHGLRSVDGVQGCEVECGRGGIAEKYNSRAAVRSPPPPPPRPQQPNLDLIPPRSPYGRRVILLAGGVLRLRRRPRTGQALYKEKIEAEAEGRAWREPAAAGRCATSAAQNHLAAAATNQCRE